MISIPYLMIFTSVHRIIPFLSFQQLECGSDDMYFKIPDGNEIKDTEDILLGQEYFLWIFAEIRTPWHQFHFSRLYPLNSC